MAKTHPKVDAVIIGVGWVGGTRVETLSRTALRRCAPTRCAAPE